MQPACLRREVHITSHYAGAWAIHDHAYYWPMFTYISGPVQYGPEDIAVFTLSKLTGGAAACSIGTC